MKLCQTCNQALAEAITTCPSCWAKVEKGKEYIGDYRVVDVIHEGHASILCRAETQEGHLPVLIRLFKPQSKMDEKVAERLKNRLEQLNKLPHDKFVQHYEIKCTPDGLWYRVSEWVEGESWSRIFAAERLKNYRVAFGLFYKIAGSLSVLHETGHFIPHLVLSDIIALKGDNGELDAKIDYKLSRFLDDDLIIPGTLLNNLLTCHPDIVNNRPLDFRSDIWSLGKIFLELLTADLDSCPTSVGIEKLSIPQEGKILLKIMLADDPTVRPQSMKEVVDSIQQIVDRKEESIKKSRFVKVPLTLKEFRRIRLRLRILATFAILLFAAGLSLIALLYFGIINKDAESAFQHYANLYSDSVAFVLVEYSLKDGDNIIYQKRVEGTAFLVDEAGYLLTNRHVACPWLLDREIFAMINRIKPYKSQVRFDYRIFLWFEGQKAYKRLPDIVTGSDLSDIYFIESAFRSDGKPSITIAGIARASTAEESPFQSPLKDDFAFLKIDKVPAGLIPLPLDKTINALDIPKLSPVITIGFPLGSRIQADHVNVSVTKGNVRRTFRDVIQVDTSIYRGNSGGPFINEQGRVIGIATGVAFEQATSVVPVLTHLSDIGIVLPIRKTVPFLQDLKSGMAKWNGVLDLSLREKIEKTKAEALAGNWIEARELADYHLRFSLEPALFKAAGMLHYCTGDNKGARQFFRKALSMDMNDYSVKLMLTLLDWNEGAVHQNPYRKELNKLNWRSDNEFYGYLSRILAGSVDLSAALRGWNTESERSWLFYIVGLINQKNGTGENPGTLFRKSAQVAPKDSWVFYLAMAELSHIYEQKKALSRSKKATSRLEKELLKINNSVSKAHRFRENRIKILAPLLLRYLQPFVSISDKREILGRMLEIDKENKATIVGLAFSSAMVEDWEAALGHIRYYLAKKGREDRAYLSIKLLELGIERKIGTDRQIVRKKLKDFRQNIDDPWYKSISKTLLAEQSKMFLAEKAVVTPENLITAHNAMGFWAEGENDPDSAIKHYQEVLGTYLKSWWEYAFAWERIKTLRRKSLAAKNPN